MGWLYLFGLPEERDEKKAKGCFRKASRQGHPQAAEVLRNLA